MPEKISVIVPVLNAAATIERCLDSITRQTYPHRELIVIDGGSSDGTVAIVRRLGNAVAHWHSGPDAGIYDAMARGVRAATGDWLYFLGADDYLYDDRVFESLFGQDTSGWDVIYGDIWWDNRRYGGRTDAYAITRRNIGHQALFVRRAVFERLGGFNPDYALLADYEMNLRLFGDPRIRTRYVDRIVAHFTTGGRSARGDERFARDKAALIRRHIRISPLRRLALWLRYKLARPGRRF